MALYNDWNKHEIPTGRRQISWLFAKRSRGVELGAIENKSSEWQGGGLGPGPPGYKSSTLTTRPRRLLNYTLLLFFVFFFAQTL